MMLEGDGVSSITFFCIKGGPVAGLVRARVPAPNIVKKNTGRSVDKNYELET